MEREEKIKEISNELVDYIVSHNLLPPQYEGTFYFSLSEKIDELFDEEELNTLYKHLEETPPHPVDQILNRIYELNVGEQVRKYKEELLERGRPDGE